MFSYLIESVKWWRSSTARWGEAPRRNLKAYAAAADLPPSIERPPPHVFWCIFIDFPCFGMGFYWFATFRDGFPSILNSNNKTEGTPSFAYCLILDGFQSIFLFFRAPEPSQNLENQWKTFRFLRFFAIFKYWLGNKKILQKCFQSGPWKLPRPSKNLPRASQDTPRWDLRVLHNPKAPPIRDLGGPRGSPRPSRDAPRPPKRRPKTSTRRPKTRQDKRREEKTR